MNRDQKSNSLPKPQIEIAFEIFCEAEKRALKSGGETPRQILKFLKDLAVEKHAFKTVRQEKEFYMEVEKMRTKLNSMYWSTAKDFQQDQKSLRPRMERAENDASLSLTPSPCELSTFEKISILSEIF